MIGSSKSTGATVTGLPNGTVYYFNRRSPDLMRSGAKRSRLELARNSAPSANPAARVLIEHAKTLARPRSG